MNTEDAKMMQRVIMRLLLEHPRRAMSEEALESAVRAEYVAMGYETIEGFHCELYVLSGTEYIRLHIADHEYHLTQSGKDAIEGHDYLT